MEYFFYRNIGVDSTFTMPEGVTIVKCFPHRKVKGMDRFSFSIKKHLSLALQTLVMGGRNSKYVEYDLVKYGVIVSRALLISRIPRYAFLPPKGVHLCCCETLPSERGKGYQCFIQKYIVADNPGMDLHLIVRADNVASIRCMEKAGFTRYAVGYRNRKGIVEIKEYIK